MISHQERRFLITDVPCCVQIYGSGALLAAFLVGEGGWTEAIDVALRLTGALVALAGIVLGAALLKGAPITHWCALYWLMQVPAIATPYFSYLFFLVGSGVLAFALRGGDFFIDGQLGSALVVRLTQDGSAPWMGLNVIALLVALVFWRARRDRVGESRKNTHASHA